MNDLHCGDCTSKFTILRVRFYVRTRASEILKPFLNHLYPKTRPEIQLFFTKTQQERVKRGSIVRWSLIVLSRRMRRLLFCYTTMSGILRVSLHAPCTQHRPVYTSRGNTKLPTVTARALSEAWGTRSRFSASASANERYLVCASATAV